MRTQEKKEDSGWSWRRWFSLDVERQVLQRKGFKGCVGIGGEQPSVTGIHLLTHILTIGHNRTRAMGAGEDLGRVVAQAGGGGGGC